MKIAILIEGEQNSGKTSTIKELVNRHSDKNNFVMRRGWQRLFLNPEFRYLNLETYCVPASPSETNIKLSDRFEKWMPDVLILAEQLNGQHSTNTNSFLTQNNYTILRYAISNIDGNSDWERFNISDKSLKLTNRVNSIMSDLRNVITSNNLI